MPCVTIDKVLVSALLALLPTASSNLCAQASGQGWHEGRLFYRQHDPASGGASAAKPLEPNNLNMEKEPRPPDKMGSPYVPLDSWVYPAIEKLAAFGYIQTAFLGLKPWTRIECAQLIEYAKEPRRRRECHRRSRRSRVRLAAGIQ
jgi:hypothetical protein